MPGPLCHGQTVVVPAGPNSAQMPILPAIAGRKKQKKSVTNWPLPLPYCQGQQLPRQPFSSESHHFLAFPHHHSHQQNHHIVITSGAGP